MERNPCLCVDCHRTVNSSTDNVDMRPGLIYGVAQVANDRNIISFSLSMEDNRTMQAELGFGHCLLC